MAKKQNAAQEVENDNVDLSIGNVDAAALDRLQFDEVDPLKGLDGAYSAGQPGFEAGTTKLGVYKGSKLCVSTKEKKPNWKEHPDATLRAKGKVCKKLHIFQAATPTGELLKPHFGLWHTGALTAMLDRVRKEQLVAITYVGVAEKAFKEGQTPPHVFKLRGKGIEVKMTDLSDLEEDFGTETPEEVNTLQSQYEAADTRPAARTA